METLTIRVDYPTTAEFKASGYPLKQAKNFGYDHLLEEDLARWGRLNPTWYIVEAEPFWNYGLDFKIYIRYWSDGLHFLKEVTLGGGASLTSAPFRRAYVEKAAVNGVFKPRYISQGTYTYPKDLEERPRLRKMCKDEGWILI
jgi:hypothetical protein